MKDQSQYIIRGAQGDRELGAILALQAENLGRNLTQTQRDQHGFVTLEHHLDLLRSMNIPWHHSIAMQGEDVVGYALVMAPELSRTLPELVTLVERLQDLTHEGVQLANSRFYIMGQVCVAAGHRGQGLIAQLYQHQREQMAPDFEYAVTDVNANNPRSLRAHERTGWKVIDRYEDDAQTWVMLLLPLAKPA